MALDTTEAPAEALAPDQTAKQALASGAKQRGPFRPETLAPVRARLSLSALARLTRGLDLGAALASAVAAAVVVSATPLLQRSVGEVLPLLIAPPVALWALKALGGYTSARE